MKIPSAPADFGRRSLECAHEALDSNQLMDQLGERGVELSETLGRIVVISSQDEVEAFEAKADASSIPLVISGPEGTLWRAGHNMISDKQALAIDEQLAVWGARSESARNLVNHNNSNLLSFGQLVLRPLRTRSAEAAVLTSGSSLSNTFIRVMFDLERPPEDTVILFRSRPAVVVNRNAHDDLLPPDLMLHEVTHVIQAEEEPIVGASSQNDIDIQTRADEIEAYLIGSKVDFSVNDFNDVYQAGILSKEKLSMHRLLGIYRLATGISDEAILSQDPQVLKALGKIIGLKKKHLTGSAFKYRKLYAQARRVDKTQVAHI